MPKQQNISHNSSDSDSEAPESLQLNTAKNSVLERERVVKDFHTSTAERRKELNKAREDVRKNAADERRRKLALIQSHKRTTPKKTSIGDNENDKLVEVPSADSRSRHRMERAMQDAEMEDASSSVGSASSTPEPDPGASEGDPSSSGSDDGDENEEGGQDGHGPAQGRLPQLSKSDVASSSRPPISAAGSYLPDEVFARAKADIDAHQAKLDVIEKRRLRRAAERAKKRGKTKTSSSSKLSSKETVVGSTLVKALAPVVRKGPAPPSDSLKQFIKHSRSKKKGRFERRPMNLLLSTGRPGPALNFRRQQ